MRILILSDLHSNATALDAVLNAVQGRWDLSVCLGDVVGYGPDPNEVTARLRELGTQTIRGNHDKAVSGLMPTDDFNPVAKSAVDWTRGQLQPDHLAWLSTLPPGPLATDGIVLVHGAFQDEDEYVRSEEHTSELQSQSNLVCRLLLEKKKNHLNVIHLASCTHPRARIDQFDIPFPRSAHRTRFH